MKIQTIRVKRCLRVLLCILFLVQINTNALAAVGGIPAPRWDVSQVGVYCSGGEGTGQANVFSPAHPICWLSRGDTPGSFGPQTYFVAGDSVDLTEEFAGDYYPINGEFGIREYLCDAAGGAARWCTMGRSFGYMDGASKFHGNTMQSVLQSNAQYGGNSRSYSPSRAFTICLVFVDAQGTAWKSADAITCADGKEMPKTPAQCRINASQDLNIDFGTLVRRNIATSEFPDDPNTIKKTVTMDCSGTASIHTSMKFIYPPIVIGGKEVVNTSSGLGIAVRVNGTDVTTTSTYEFDYQPGDTPISLEFEPVRPDHLPVGDFKASIVMVVSQM